VCYKRRIVPCLPKEVLMRRSVIHPRLVQPTLFRSVPERPSFRTLPSEIQTKTVRLLARLLRGHVDRVVAAVAAPEGRDE
jgi:hypothetical protein